MFGRIVGRIYWACPVCNAMNVQETNSLTTMLLCRNCSLRFIHGLTLWKKPAGNHRIPRDTLLINEGFANRRLANKALCDECGKALWDKARDQEPGETREKAPPGKSPDTRVNHHAQIEYATIKYKP